MTRNSAGVAFGSKVMSGLRSTLRNLDKKSGGHYFDKAAALTEARKQLGTTDRFKEWLKDSAKGMGYTTGQCRACDRLISALKKVPERKLWERLGWYDGVSRLESIPKSAERAAVLEEIKKKRGVLTTSAFKELLSNLAPSLSQRDSVRRDNEQAEELKQLRAELDALRKWTKGSVRKYPFLSDTLTPDLRETLGIRRS